MAKKDLSGNLEGLVEGLSGESVDASESRLKVQRRKAVQRYHKKHKQVAITLQAHEALRPICDDVDFPLGKLLSALALTFIEQPEAFRKSLSAELGDRQIEALITAVHHSSAS